MPSQKRTSKRKPQLRVGRDVNIVQLGVNAKADQVAAGEMVKQNTALQPAPDPRDAAIVANAVRAAELELGLVADATLDEEIKMLRKFTKHVAQLIEDAEPERAPALLNALSLATTRVAKLLKAQRELTGKRGGLATLLQKAFREVLAEKRARAGGNP